MQYTQQDAATIVAKFHRQSFYGATVSPSLHNNYSTIALLFEDTFYSPYQKSALYLYSIKDKNVS